MVEKFDIEMKFIPVKEMDKFPFGLVFFGEKHPVYVSPTMYEDIKAGTVTNLPYAMLVYRRGETPIEDVVLNIIDEVKDGLREKYEAGVLDNIDTTD